MIGDFIRVNRIANGYTVNYFAQIMGASPSSIWLWERHRVIPSLRMLKKLARIFGVSIDELVGRQPSPSLQALSNLKVIRVDGSIDESRIQKLNTLLQIIEDYRG